MPTSGMRATSNPNKSLILESLERSLLKGAISRRAFVKLSMAAGLVSATSVNALAEQLDEIRANQAKLTRTLKRTYDYVVCGAGTAGCALVGRLAANRGANILLIEAGDWDTAPSVLDPRVWFTNLGTERDWGDVAIPSAGVNNRVIPEHMGRVLGGGSSINATIWARPFKNDLEYWAKKSGSAEWGYEHSLSIFRRMENWQGKSNARYRGKGGPVWCQPAYDPLPVAPAMLEACRKLGLPVLDDLNGEREETGNGFALMNNIIKDGRRQSMARSYLYPVLTQENITLLTNTHVDKLIIEGERITGVQFVRDGQLVTIAADKEVILSAGGIRTPQLLMLSGVGNEADLKAAGVKPIIHSPEVGKNFQDHILHGGCLWEAPSAMGLHNSGAEVSGYLKSDSNLELPDISVVQIELPYTSEVIAKAYNPPATSWALCAGLVAPKSRGQVKLKSSSPADKPIIDANFLSHPDDVAAIERSIELAREIGNSPALRPFAKREVVPGKKLAGKELSDFIRNGATTYFHISGTCRMGSDTEAVVDAELRVKGVRNLRIADSSVMPRIVAVPTMAACVLIGERMSDILKRGA